MMRLRLATVWLDGCSGCHMSFLDIDERLLEIAEHVELVYSPLVDQKAFPDHVDVTLVEGAVSSEEDLEKIRHIRQHTDILVSLGDCAVMGNVPSLRNTIDEQSVLRRVYLSPELTNPQIPTQVVPRLLPVVKPVHAVVKVDVFVPGCPPRSEVILEVLTGLINGRTDALKSKSRFGA
jgi:NAD-reducing hydrogenase small subunit